MKQSHAKPSSLRLITVLLVIAAVLVIHSCKKDKQEKATVDAVVTDPAIEQAKQWYNSAYPAVSTSKLATQSINKPSHDWSKMFFPNWAKANTYVRDGNTYIEMPAIKVGNMAISFTKPKDTVNFDFSRSGSVTSLLIVKRQNDLSMYAMTILADTSYLKGDYSKLSKNTYQNIDKDFTGAVFFNQMDGTFVNGWRYQKGIIVRQLSPYIPLPSGQSIQSISNKITVDTEEPCGAIVSVTVYEDCYTYPSGTSLCYISSVTDVMADCPSGGGGTSSGTSGGGSSSPCIPPPASSSSIQPVVINAVKSSGLVINVAMPPPGGGSTTPCPPVTIIKLTSAVNDITDNVTNPCLKALLDRLTTDKTIQTDVTSILRNTFGTSDAINITFDQATLTGSHSTDAANTDGQNDNFTVTFNTPAMAGASQEYMLETAMHEIFHAYLYVNPTISKGFSQHAYMIQNYVNTEVITLQKVFPNLSLHDAQCLVLAGYGALDPTTLNSAISSYGLTLNDVANTNNNYKSSISGAHCPTP